MEEKRLIYIEVHQLKKQRVKITQIFRRTTNEQIRFSVESALTSGRSDSRQNQTNLVWTDDYRSELFLKNSALRDLCRDFQNSPLRYLCTTLLCLFTTIP